MDIELESACCNVTLDCHNGLIGNEVSLILTTHAGERITVIVHIDELEALLAARKAQVH